MAALRHFRERQLRQRRFFGSGSQGTIAPLELTDRFAAAADRRGQDGTWTVGVTLLSRIRKK